FRAANGNVPLAPRAAGEQGIFVHRAKYRFGICSQCCPSRRRLGKIALTRCAPASFSVFKNDDVEMIGASAELQNDEGALLIDAGGRKAPRLKPFLIDIIELLTAVGDLDFT